MESVKAIICRIGAEEYALNVTHVLSIERIQNIRPLPHTEPFMAGIMQLRGAVVPVMDLRIWLGIEKSDAAGQDHQRIIVTEVDGRRLGLIVDAATDVLDIEDKVIQSVETQHGAREVKNVANLESRMILILDIPKLVEQLDASVFDDAETA